MAVAALEKLKAYYFLQTPSEKKALKMWVNI